MNHKSFITISLMSVSMFLAACGNTGTANYSETSGEEIPLSYSENLKLSKFPDYVKAEIQNPWDSTKTLHTYILVPDSLPVPAGRPEGTVVRIPLKNSVVFSSVHSSLISEFGAPDAISGVCDADYLYQEELTDRLKSGEIVDCGNSMSPNLEKIIKLNPDAILLSPFENSGNYGKLGQLGIPIIECADYMETSPLGRAEWIKFYGMLYGKDATSSKLFDDTEKEYLSLKQFADTVKIRPKVLFDRLYGSSWSVPTKNSTTGVFIKDAGGVNPFDYIDSQGSAQLAGEQVLVNAGDADVWIIRYSQNTDKSLIELSSDNDLYSQFKAFKNKNVYGCNTSKTFYFEETPFHPHWLLREMISIIHPEIELPVGNNIPTNSKLPAHDSFPIGDNRYFKKMK